MSDQPKPALRRPVKGDEFLEYSRRYANQVIARFRALSPPATETGKAILEDARAQEAKLSQLNEQPGTTDDEIWDVIYRLERAAIELESPAALVEHYVSLVQEQAESEGLPEPARAVEDVRKAIAGPPPMGEGAMRAAAAQALEEIHYRYAGYWLLDTLLSRLRRWTSGYAGGALVLMVGSLWLATSRFDGGCCLPLPLVAVIVCFAGVTGACASNLHRLQTIDIKRSAEIVLLQSADTSWGSVGMRPLLGAVFALVMLWLCHAGALSGGVFPKLDNLVCQPTCGEEMQKAQPADAKPAPSAKAKEEAPPGDARPPAQASPAKDAAKPVPPWPELAKLLLWAFIAGFLDKLVPSHLQRLADGSSPAPAASTTGSREPASRPLKAPPAPMPDHPPAKGPG